LHWKKIVASEFSITSPTSTTGASFFPGVDNNTSDLLHLTNSYNNGNAISLGGADQTDSAFGFEGNNTWNDDGEDMF